MGGMHRARPSGCMMVSHIMSLCFARGAFALLRPSATILLCYEGAAADVPMEKEPPTLALEGPARLHAVGALTPWATTGFEWRRKNRFSMRAPRFWWSQRRRL